MQNSDIRLSIRGKAATLEGIDSFWCIRGKGLCLSTPVLLQFMAKVSHAKDKGVRSQQQKSKCWSMFTAQD
jgi:hypothetical protein